MNNLTQRMAIAGVILLLAGPAMAAQPSFEIDVKELDAGRQGQARPVPKTIPKASKARPVAKEALTAPVAAGEYVTYTVKPGDHIFKILLRDFHLSNTEAERLIPEIARVNKVPDLRRLAVGQTLRIPRTLTVAGRPAAKKRVQLKAAEEAPARTAVAEQPLKAVVEEPAAKAVVEEPPVKAVVEEAPAKAAVEEPPAKAAVVAPPATTPPATPAGPRPETVAPAPALVTEPVPRPSAQPEPKGGEAAPAIAPSPPAIAPVGSVLAVTINGGDPLNVFLRLADVLQLQVQSNRVIESGAGTTESFSIKVPLYAEGQGKRLIVAGGGQDPFQYTLFRLLEAEGYGVLQFRDNDGFREVTAITLAKLGHLARLGRFRLVNGKEQEVLGYLLNTPSGKMLLTDAPVGGIWSALEVAGE